MTRPRALVVVAAAAAVLTAMNLSVWLAGASPRRVLAFMLAGTLGYSYGFAQSLAKATPLLWTGASVALALRARLFNVGAEGQCLAGVLASAVVGAALPASTPWVLAIPFCLAAAAAGGAALGAVAGWLRDRFGTNEVLSTLMLNGLMAVVVTWLYGGALRDGAQVHTRDVVAGARLPMASWASCAAAPTIGMPRTSSSSRMTGSWISRGSGTTSMSGPASTTSATRCVL